jgi:hypothetical protein
LLLGRVLLLLLLCCLLLLGRVLLCLLLRCLLLRYLLLLLTRVLLVLLRHTCRLSLFCRCLPALLISRFRVIRLVIYRVAMNKFIVGRGGLCNRRQLCGIVAI